MKTLPLVLGTALYAWQAVNCAVYGQFAMAGCFCAYAAANVCLVLAL